MVTFFVQIQDYFYAVLNEPDSYSFVNCMVSPGFDVNDCKIIDSTDLISKFDDIVKRHK